jgi:hypothetical protein
MDVHKEAVVIAVLNGNGKLVMETIVEKQSHQLSAIYPRSTGRALSVVSSLCCLANFPDQKYYSGPDKQHAGRFGHYRRGNWRLK